MAVYVNGQLQAPVLTSAVTTSTITATGNVALGDAAGDTFKTHGTAGTGAQSAFVAAVSQTSADTSAIVAADVDASAAKLTSVQALQVDYDKMVIDMAATVALLNACKTCLVNHGLMAAS